MVFKKEGNIIYVSKELNTCNYCDKKAVYYVKTISIFLTVRDRELCKEHHKAFMFGIELK